MKRVRYVLIDIDTQNDFLDPKGSLFMHGGDEIIPNLKRLFQWAADNNVPIVSTVDSHIPDDPEFREFPPHCVVGTWGHRKITETTNHPYRLSVVGGNFDPIDLYERQQIVFQKRTYDVFDNPNIERYLASVKAEAFVVCGVATDYCVGAVVKKLLELGRKIFLVIDAIAAVDPATENGIIQDFERQGVTLIRTDQAVAMKNEYR